MSFIAELRQRKVFRVATVYLVVAWVSIEAASIALPAFEAPAWTLRVVILLFLLGFPLALLLTWVLELTPDGLQLATSRVGNRRMAAVVAGLAALAIAWFILGQPAYRVGEAVAGERSIAVLPFVNMSGDPSNEYFSDGLAETTLDMLAQVHDLKVVARTSSFAFKGTNTDVREIGRQLDVAHLLEGSVQQAGDTVRITAQLVRTSDGSHVWSRRFDRRLADVFAIQDEIATAVVAALQMALPADEQAHLLRKRTQDVAAYQAYLKGLALLPERRVSDIRLALGHFERAIAIDPDYARAHAAAATALVLLDTYATMDGDERLRQARHIERALELAPDLGEAHIAQAAQLEQARDLPGAERAFRRGIELAPGYATAYQWFGEFLLFEKAQVQAALQMFERARALDPLSPIIRSEHAFALAASGQVDRALGEVDALIAAHPDFAAAHGTRAELLGLRGDLPGALRAWRELEQRDPEALTRRINRCRTMVRFGALQEGRACADDAIARAPGQQWVGMTRAWFAAMEGNFPEALELVRSDSSRDPWTFAMILLANDRPDEAIEVLRGVVPELFEQPLPAPQTVTAMDGILVGTALLQSGAVQKGRRVLEFQLHANTGRPHGSVAFFGREWHDVFAHAALGNTTGACAALAEGVEAGYVLDIPLLDVHPGLAELREQPCFERVLAPARVQAATQVAAARRAGLLGVLALPAPRS